MCGDLFQYSSMEEAIATREALHGVKWPSSNPKVLRVDFCEKDEVCRFQHLCAKLLSFYSFR